MVTKCRKGISVQAKSEGRHDGVQFSNTSQSLLDWAVLQNCGRLPLSHFPPPKNKERTESGTERCTANTVEEQRKVCLGDKFKHNFYKPIYLTIMELEKNIPKNTYKKPKEVREKVVCDIAMFLLKCAEEERAIPHYESQQRRVFE